MMEKSFEVDDIQIKMIITKELHYDYFQFINNNKIED